MDTGFSLGNAFFIDMFQRTKESKYFEYIINYIENESKVQDLDTLSGLGEPKINIDCTPFNGEWGDLKMMVQH